MKDQSGAKKFSETRRLKSFKIEEIPQETIQNIQEGLWAAILNWRDGFCLENEMDKTSWKFNFKIVKILSKTKKFTI